ncbi:MAG: hypothetical protein MUE37_01060 [Bacteroidales bacterium]|jgi:hypothetical protein|nr:hypothetical protein [Bacteroidales bacterium]
MSFFKTLKNGATVTASSYKLILVIWISMLVLTLAAGYPLKAFMNSIFGKSMITERLNDGFDIALAGEIGKPFGALVTSVTAGTVLVGTAGFILMVFFAGGLFRRFTLAEGRLKVSEFLKASATSFMPFLWITLLMMLIIAGYTLLVIGVPALVMVLVSGSKMPSGNGIYIFYVIWALGMPLWLFVADASRRWMAATGSRQVFRAIGAAFRALRERFWLNYGIVFAVVVLNLLLVLAILWFAAFATPDKGIMVFLFFIATQALVVVRLMMKAWRYAVVCEAVQQQRGEAIP